MPDLFFRQYFRRASKMLSQVSDGVTVARDGAGLFSSEQQILAKPLGEVRVKSSERGLFLKSSLMS